jgi:signal transduction histidine kinase
MKREQELSAVRADFLAAVSHELRTPLAQIRMFAELLKTGSMRQPEETRRALNVIEKESSRLSILVDNVLNYAALHRNTERVPLTERPATEVTRDIESSAKQSTTALVNSQALRQILLNLLENAVKYGPRGQTVTIGTDRQTARVKVWVDDQGPGIPAAERASIWLPFKRGSSGTASKTGGSGIGLSVVQDLAEQNDGKAWVEDAPGGGARFIVEFDSIRASSGSADNGYRREPAVIIPG